MQAFYMTAVKYLMIFGETTGYTGSLSRFACDTCQQQQYIHIRLLEAGETWVDAM